jgi:hypothetical protein
VNIDRRTKDGRTQKEAVRCLNRDVAREVFAVLLHSQFGIARNTVDLGGQWFATGSARSRGQHPLPNHSWL